MATKKKPTVQKSYKPDLAYDPVVARFICSLLEQSLPAEDLTTALIRAKDPDAEFERHLLLWAREIAEMLAETWAHSGDLE